MTGAERGELAQRLRNDDELRERVLSAFRGRGMSRKEAAARYERVADVAEIMAIPPSQRTEEQKATVKAAEADPTFKQDQKAVAKIASDDAPASSSKLQTSFADAATGIRAIPIDMPAPVAKSVVPVGNSPGL